MILNTLSERGTARTSEVRPMRVFSGITGIFFFHFFFVLTPENKKVSEC